jgi:plastocyanin
MRWLVLCLTVLFLAGCGGVAVERSPHAQPAAEPVAEPVGKPAPLVVTTGVDGMLAYQPPVLFAKQGESVEITLVNADRAQAHSFVIPELQVKSRQVMPGQKETLTFVADKAGDYRFYCDVPGHKDGGEVGRFTVEP